MNSKFLGVEDARIMNKVLLRGRCLFENSRIRQYIECHRTTWAIEILTNFANIIFAKNEVFSWNRGYCFEYEEKTIEKGNSYYKFSDD